MKVSCCSSPKQKQNETVCACCQKRSTLECEHEVPREPILDLAVRSALAWEPSWIWRRVITLLLFTADLPHATYQHCCNHSFLSIHHISYWGFMKHPTFFLRPFRPLQSTINYHNELLSREIQTFKTFEFIFSLKEHILTVLLNSVPEKVLKVTLFCYTKIPNLYTYLSYAF